MVQLESIGNMCKLYILLKWLSDITGGHLSKLEIKMYPGDDDEHSQRTNYDVLPLKVDALSVVHQSFCFETPILEWIDVGRLDYWEVVYFVFILPRIINMVQCESYNYNNLKYKTILANIMKNTVSLFFSTVRLMQSLPVLFLYR